jgi:mxaA protein
MKKLMRNLLLMTTLSLSTFAAYALDVTKLPDVKDGIVSIQTQDPVKDVGYVVGDVVTRHITLTIKKPYVLIEESLPIVGYEKTYRGQPIGVYLSALSHTKKDEGDQVVHQLTLDYQIFTSSVVAKRAAVLAEYVRLLNTESKDREVVKYRVPMWEFVISPLSVFGQIKIEDDMSQFRGPLLMDTSNQEKRLKTSLVLLVLSLLGLLYIVGKNAWLPRMGGPFAKAYRTIKKQTNTPQGNMSESLRVAVSSMHAALNTSAGHSLFADNLDEFLAKKPAFTAIKSEIQQFFGLSNQVFFEANAKHNVGAEPVAWLKQFCRRCRDCERGLLPDTLSTKNKA